VLLGHPKTVETSPTILPKTVEHEPLTISSRSNIEIALMLNSNLSSVRCPTKRAMGKVAAAMGTRITNPTMQMMLTDVSVRARCLKWLASIFKH
jgi:hypothetical protein